MNLTLKKGIIDSLKVAMVVGTLLSLINQWEAILSYQINGIIGLRVFFNYLIPFTVAGYSKMQVVRLLRKEQQ